MWCSKSTNINSSRLWHSRLLLQNNVAKRTVDPQDAFGAAKEPCRCRHCKIPSYRLMASWRDFGWTVMDPYANYRAHLSTTCLKDFWGMQGLLGFTQNERAAISCLLESTKILDLSYRMLQDGNDMSCILRLQPKKRRKAACSFKTQTDRWSKTCYWHFGHVESNIALSNKQFRRNISCIANQWHKSSASPFPKKSFKPITKSNFWTPRGWYQIAFL